MDLKGTLRIAFAVKGYGWHAILFSPAQMQLIATRRSGL